MRGSEGSGEIYDENIQVGHFTLPIKDEQYWMFWVGYSIVGAGEINAHITFLPNP
jgi:hypothetical protein